MDQRSSTVMRWTYFSFLTMIISLLCWWDADISLICLHPHFSASENLYLFSYSLNIKNNCTIWRIRNKSFSFQRICICTHRILITVHVTFSLISAEIHTLLLHIRDLCVPDYRTWVLITLRCLNVFYLIPNRIDDTVRIACFSSTKRSPKSDITVRPSHWELRKL